MGDQPSPRIQDIVTQYKELAPDEKMQLQFSTVEKIPIKGLPDREFKKESGNGFRQVLMYAREEYITILTNLCNTTFYRRWKLYLTLMVMKLVPSLAGVVHETNKNKTPWCTYQLKDTKILSKRRNLLLKHLYHVTTCTSLERLKKKEEWLCKDVKPRLNKQDEKGDMQMFHKKKVDIETEKAKYEEPMEAIRRLLTESEPEELKKYMEEELARLKAKYNANIAKLQTKTKRKRIQLESELKHPEISEAKRRKKQEEILKLEAGSEEKEKTLQLK